MSLSLLVSVFEELLLFFVIAEFDLNGVEFVMSPVLLGSLSPLDIIVCFLFQVMQLQVTVGHNVKLTQFSLLSSLASLFLLSNEIRKDSLTFGGSGPGRLSGSA